MALDEYFRLSDYTIPIVLDSEPSKILLVHGYTGAIDLVDMELWRQLRKYPEQNDLTSEEIKILSKRGFLTLKTSEEEQSYVARFAEKLHASRLKLHKNCGFVVTYNCNFRCPYCFENRISKHGTAWSKKSMTPELVDRAFEAMLEIEPRKELHKKSILLYGGEPLLRENHEIVKYIVEKGVANGYVFHVISNGYDLDYFEELLSRDNFNHFQISIDGWREYHNRRKWHYSEGGSFDKVIANIGLLLKHEIPVSIRINTDAANFGDIKKIQDHFSAIGYDKSPYFSVYVANIEDVKNVNYAKSLKYVKTDDFVKNIKGESSKLMSSHMKILYKSFKSYFTEGKRLHFSSEGCAGQYGTHIFDPAGAIYTCLETVGRQEHCIGYINSDEISWTEHRKKWFGKHVGNSKICEKCRYALLCGGNCAIKEFDGANETQLCMKSSSMLNYVINKAYSVFYQNK